MMEASVETELQVVGVDLANQDRVDLAVAQIGSELGDAEQGFAAAVALGDVWLFIDNVEQLLPDFAGAVSDALARVPQLRILVTSRRPLGLLTEALIPLGPLDSEAAQALFLDRALRRDPNYLADPMQLSQIVKLLDYWPLAIELAAARSRLYPIGELVARMKSGVDLLEVTEADRPERHRSLRGALDWSWQLLSDAEKQALVALAAFPDGFSMAAAEHVLGPRASDRVLALIEHSWCWRADDGRFRMLAPAREFAVAHADGRVREQVCAWFASLVPEDLLERVHLGEPLIDQWRRESAGLELGLLAQDPLVRLRCGVALVLCSSARVAPETAIIKKLEAEAVLAPVTWRVALAVAMGESAAGFGGRRVVALAAGLSGQERARVLLAAVPNAALGEGRELEGWLTAARAEMGDDPFLVAYERLATGVWNVREGHLAEALTSVWEAERLAKIGGWTRLLESRAGQRLRIQWEDLQEAIDETEPVAVLLSMQLLARALTRGFEYAMQWRETYFDRPLWGGIGDVWARALGALLEGRTEATRLALEQWPRSRRNTAVYQLFELSTRAAETPGAVRAELAGLRGAIDGQSNDWARFTCLCVEAVVQARAGDARAARVSLGTVGENLTAFSAKPEGMARRLWAACAKAVEA